MDKKFLNYLNSLSDAEREDFAARCETTFDYLRQVAYGNRPCREKLAINIERESGRAFTCEELCPDVDWAYLRTTPTDPDSLPCSLPDGADIRTTKGGARQSPKVPT